MPFLSVKTNSIKASKETVCVTVYVLVMVLFGTDYDLGDARASAPVAEHQWVQHAWATVQRCSPMELCISVVRSADDAAESHSPTGDAATCAL